MPVWRCPHCGTPQAETSRCWVCHLSTTSCATCRHFRRGVANGLGLCGLNPRRAALRGDEIRDCWTAPAPMALDDPPISGAIATAPDPTRRPPRTFVPVDELTAIDAGAGPSVTEAPVAGTPVAGALPATPAGRSDAGGVAAGGWSLWGDVEG